MKTSLFLGTALTAMLVTGIASAAGEKSYIADKIDGPSEKPTATDSAATAEARFTYYPDTKKLCGHVTFTPKAFTEKVTGLHIHTVDKTKGDGTGDVLIGLPTTATDGTVTVNVAVDAADATALDAEELYVNAHTELHAGGEIRGELKEDGDQDTLEPCEGDDADAGASSSSSSSSSGSSTSDGGASSSSGTAATPAATDDGGCNTSGGNGTGSGLAIAAGLGLVLAAASRKRNKKA